MGGQRVKQKGAFPRPYIMRRNAHNMTNSLIYTPTHRMEARKKFNLPDRWSPGPLVMCVKVEFKHNGGQVIFTGAGARFEES